MEQVKKRSECPISCSLEVFGDKWSLLIIRDLMFGPKVYLEDFLKSAEGIATNILAARLKGLWKKMELLKNREHPDSKAKVLYRLTPKGIDLLPFIMEIYIWSEKYYEMPTDLKATIKEAKKDKDKFVKQVSKELKMKMTENKSSR